MLDAAMESDGAGAGDDDFGDGRHHPYPFFDLWSVLANEMVMVI